MPVIQESAAWLLNGTGKKTFTGAEMKAIEAGKEEMTEWR
jgi:hypothetical protein